MSKAALAQRPPTDFPGSGKSYRGKLNDLKNQPPNSRSSLPATFDGLQASYRQRTGENNANLPKRDDALDLHEFRNSVQHHGVVPSEIDLQRSRIRANDAFDAVLGEFFGRKRDELSRALLIVNETARGFVKKAEAAAATDDYDQAAGEMLVASKLILDGLRSTVLLQRRGTGLDRDISKKLDELADRVASGRLPRGDHLTDEDRLIAGLAHRLSAAEQGIELLALGGDVATFRWIDDRFVAPITIGRGADIEVISYVRQEQMITAGEYQRLYAAVIGLAVRGQPQTPKYAGQRPRSVKRRPQREATSGPDD